MMNPLERITAFALKHSRYFRDKVNDITLARNGVMDWDDITGSRNELLKLKFINEKLAYNQAQGCKYVNRAMPVTLTIGTTLKCNLSCPMCVRRLNPKADDRPLSMSSDLYKKIASEVFPYVKTVALSNSGEPLASENILEELEIARRYMADVVITTNGTLLDNDRLIDAVLKSSCALNISFDAAQKDTYETIRLGADYHKVLGNIERFIKLRKDRARPKLGFCIVLMKKNIREFVQWVELAASAGADYLKAVHMTVFLDNLKDESLINYMDQADEMILAASGKAEELGLEYSFPPLYGNAGKEVDGDRQVSKCLLPWTNSWIDCLGEVGPCCNPSKEILGNVQEMLFEKIWNDSGYRSLRESICSDNPKEMCMHCCYSPQQTIDPCDKITYFYADKRK